MSTHENRVILVGTLVNLGRGDRKEASFERRSNLGATITTFSLELATPFGDAFSIPLEATAQTVGRELLTRPQIGHPLVVEGTIRRRIATDRRMAVEDSDIGTRMVETQITVAQIRAAREDEPVGVSAVWIEGKVQTPPRINSHRLLRDMDMARMIVQITLKHASSYPGSKAQITEQMEVMVVLPTLADSGAEALYQPGNVVRIEGQLDMTRVPQVATIIQGKLDAMEQEWKAQRAALEAAIPNSQERDRQVQIALRRYRNQIANMQETPLLTVVAGYVELVQGETLTEAEVAEVARESVRTGRTARLARVRRGQQQNERPAATVPAVEAAPAPQTAESIRPRRRDNGHIVAAPRLEMESARRERPIQAVPPMAAIMDGENVLVAIERSVQEVNDVQDHVVEEAHRAAATVVDVPSDTDVVDTMPEQPLAEARPRRRREPVLANGIAELVEG